MKLLFCPYCEDVLKLQYEKRKCKCGKTFGKYLSDGDKVEVSEKASVIGLSNRSLIEWMLSTSKERMDLDCWMFEPDYHKIKRIVD